MLQKGYILKLIDEASKFLALALKLRNANDYKSSAEQIQMAYDTLVRKERLFFEEFTDSDLDEYLNKLELEQCKYLADIFYADAMLFKHLNDNASAAHFAKLALNSYLFFEKNATTLYLDIASKKEELKAIIG